MKKEILESLIKEGNSTYKIANKLGKVPNTVEYWIKKFDLSGLYKSNSKYRYQKGQIVTFGEIELKSIVDESNSLTDCLNKMGVKAQGNNYKTLEKRLTSSCIDTSHFNPDEIRDAKLKAYVKSKEIPLIDILIKNSDYSRSSLKRRLYKEELKSRKCEICNQGEDWNGKKMSLILDHINGIYNDNELENLRIVCPNCNATLDTHAGKNCIKKGRKPYIPKVRKSTKDKINIELLKKELWKVPTYILCKKYNVSDVCLDKICKKISILKPKRGYWSKFKNSSVEELNNSFDSDSKDSRFES